MTLRELKTLLAYEPSCNDDLEIKIWLPGSSISLHHKGTLIAQGRTLMIEGSVDEDSALYRK